MRGEGGGERKESVREGLRGNGVGGEGGGRTGIAVHVYGKSGSRYVKSLSQKYVIKETSCRK